jgi:hypothetical protein
MLKSQAVAAEDFYRLLQKLPHVNPPAPDMPQALARSTF